MPSKASAAERLANLKRVAEEIAPDTLWMDVWEAQAGETFHPWSAKLVAPGMRQCQQWHCGTVRCLAGWATLDHFFQGQGLSMWRDDHGHMAMVQYTFPDEDGKDYTVHGHGALQLFFHGLELPTGRYNTDYLFSTSTYVHCQTPEEVHAEVLRRIDQLIELNPDV